MLLRVKIPAPPERVVTRREGSEKLEYSIS